ncbi:lantibiotic dehydratase [Streptomyces sp. 110]|uniref:Lantibiotic dehydratase n=1 Tax=Streptomyces endocoffeicus TaxID=2898945 RepID=A0ABS1Q3N9_9ACTN|nr:lantibiotic dehydratase [Streptomyces endocoffeicus]MBL1119189.1 lantibiotic dehydratase [Streptomyces endocoffeicus]
MARIPLLASGANQEDGLFAEGLFLASRSLEQAPNDSHRAAVTRTAYAIRARTRTTPHGVWCAVAAARLEGNRSVLRLGKRHQTVTVPSPQWLLSFADRVLELPGVVPTLALTVNNLVVRRGTRYEVEHPGPDGSGHLGTVRVTQLSEWLLEVCADRTSGSDVIAAVVNRYPGATAEAAQAAVVHMIRTGVLLSDLLPEDLRGDPLGHLLRKVPEPVPEHGLLIRLRRLLGEADQHRPGAAQRLTLLRSARDFTDRLHSVERPITVDTLADADIQLPAAIGVKAAQAAAALWRISHRAPPLRPWTERFTTTYGHHRMVPLLEAIDPAIGIGPPGPDDAIAATAGIGEQRDRVLASLLTDALVHGRCEVELTEAHIEQLDHGTGLPPRSAEIHVRLLPEPGNSSRLMVGHHAAQQAGSAAGRFARWLSQLAPTAKDGKAVVAEIVCRPLTARTAALAVESGFAPYRIPVGCPARDGDLHLDDLAITAVARHLRVWSLTLQRQVVPVLFSRITRGLLPPTAHLLHLLGHVDERPWHTWSWGRGSCFPYTPRVTYRGTILAPQRWILPDGLVTAAAKRSTWCPRLAAWLARTHPPVPEAVVAEESDRQLPLHLRDTDHQEILRRTVLRGARSLTEALGHHDHEPAVEGPHGRHPLELVIALHRRAQPPPARIDPRTALRPRSADTRAHGRDWLSAAIPVSARHQDAVLQQLPPVPAAAGLFWLRYDTPALGPHLRLRYHADPEALNRLQHTLAQWAADLAEQRLSSGHLYYEPYVRETQRYGGPHAIEAAEAVFAADSALVLAALRDLRAEEDRLLLAARSAAAIARTVASPTAARGGLLTPAERRRREQLRDPARFGAIPARLAMVWTARQAALDGYRVSLPTLQTAERCASDLIHMHCNRLLGPYPGHERIARSLATDLLHSHG